MKSWLKWGIILLSCNIALIFVFLLISGGAAKYDDPVTLLYLPSFLITDALYWGGNSTLAVFIFSSIFYFLVGAILGWIIGKIKSHRVISN